MSTALRCAAICQGVLLLAVAAPLAADPADQPQSACTLEKMGSKLQKTYHVTVQYKSDTIDPISEAWLAVSQKAKAAGCDRFVIMKGYKSESRIYSATVGRSISIDYILIANDDLHPFIPYGVKIENVLSYPGESISTLESAPRQP